MKYLIILFASFSFCIFSTRASLPKIPENVSDALAILDREVANYRKSEKILQDRIDSLKSLSDESAHKYFLLAEENRKINVDSALHYYHTTQKLAATEKNDTLYHISTLRLASLLPVAGYLAEAERIFESYAPDSIPISLRDDYYRAGNQMYFYAVRCVSNPDQINEYGRKGKACTDSLLNYLSPGTNDYLLYSAQHNMLSGDMSLAIADISDILASGREDESFSIAASMAAYYYSKAPSTIDRQIIYLAVSAAGDLKSGRHEMTALQELGKILHSRNDNDRANRYLYLALELTLKSGSRLTIMKTADIMPDISRYAENKANAGMGVLIAMVLALVAAIAMILWLLFRVYRSRDKLKAARQSLADSLNVRDQYIRNLLALCSECFNRLEDFNRIASRKIKARQVNELYELIQSRKIVHDQFARFLDTFDTTFLRIYPDFVSEVNAFLQPDRQYPATPDRTLTPELRILAMMRLGIDDSGTIARFLDLSVNTVYTYRNKIKNRALNREKFESEIKNRS